MMEKPKEKVLKDVPVEKIIKEILPFLRSHMPVFQFFRTAQDYSTENPQIEFEEEYNNILLSESEETKAFYGSFSFEDLKEYHYLKVFINGKLIIDLYAAKEDQKVFLKGKIYELKDEISNSVIKKVLEILGKYE